MERRQPPTRPRSGSGEFFLRLARREREVRKRWGGAGAVDVWRWVAKCERQWWLKSEENILSPTRCQRPGGVGVFEHANVGSGLPQGVNWCPLR